MEGITKPKKRGTRSKTPRMAWASSLYKIKSQILPGVGMASDAMYVLNSIVDHYKSRLITESFNSAEQMGSGTVKAKHARTAAALLLTGKLLKHTNREGEKAFLKYASVA